MAAEMFLLKEFLPLSALGLGWLADSLKTPTMDAHQLDKLLTDDDMLRSKGQDFEALVASANTNSFRLMLTRLLTNEHSRTNKDEVHLASVQVNRYQLRQPKALFRKLVQEEQARAWLNESIEGGRKSYMIVELQTAFDPSLSQAHDKKHSTDVDLTVPVSTILTGGVDVLGLADQLDSGVGGGYSRAQQQVKTFSLGGEQIFAIGFKKIVWKSLGFRKDIDRAALEDKVTWSVFGKKRGNNEEEVISAELSDAIDTATDENVDEEDVEDDVNEEESAGRQVRVAAGEQIYVINDTD